MGTAPSTQRVTISPSRRAWTSSAPTPRRLAISVTMTSSDRSTKGSILVGARTAIVTCAEPPKLLRDTCDVTILVLVGPEVVTGSTRMKAGTATKLVLNTITTGAMVRLGKVYGNLMVDLRALNAKLVDRSERIVMETTGARREAARSAIEAAGGGVKRAIVMLRRGVGAAEADRMLEEHGGHLRPVVGDPPPPGDA